MTVTCGEDMYLLPQQKNKISELKTQTLNNYTCCNAAPILNSGFLKITKGIYFVPKG
jgi:hypothetical protein